MRGRGEPDVAPARLDRGSEPAFRPAPATSPGGTRGEAGGGSDNGGGSTGASLNMTRFRTLVVSVSPDGAGTVSDDFGSAGSAVRECVACRQRYRLGTRVVLTATPAPSTRFTRWQGDACDGTASPTCILTVDRDLRVTAVFDGGV